jgi:dephospho-CoA kinase
MRVIGTVGLPGSGKGEFAEVAREQGVPVVTMGDVIREECRARGLDPSDHHGEVAQALREEDGPLAIAERTVPRVREAMADEDVDTVLVDGLRSGDELDCFRDAFGDDFTLVAIEAPFEVRAERIEARGRDNTAEETLRDRDDRELGFGMGDAIDRADVRIDNDESLDAFRAAVREFLS